jgi:hypothetical protein
VHLLIRSISRIKFHSSPVDLVDGDVEKLGY